MCVYLDRKRLGRSYRSGGHCDREESDWSALRTRNCLRGNLSRDRDQVEMAGLPDSQEIAGGIGATDNQLRGRLIGCRPGCCRVRSIGERERVPHCVSDGVDCSWASARNGNRLYFEIRKS